MPLPLACSQSPVADGANDVADGRCLYDGCVEGDVDMFTASWLRLLLCFPLGTVPRHQRVYLLRIAEVRIDMPCCLSANIYLTLIFGPAARLSLPGRLEMPVITSACADTTDPTSQPANQSASQPSNRPTYQ